ncbi:type II toxin-antitoxin system death-on-curing family toxin [Lacimonas salitolerans]|uniref:Type II toxin-antitoxin system death-on-curing family toxin n=1 Tax=Lacimonas salitolerans TaxID=1323750 RepID=A0ABW4EG09_9RHOB
MNFVILTPAIVEALHDAALNPGELQGRALDTSLEGALARVENRILYGMIEDMFDLAAAYAEAVSQGRFFNDASMRTAFEAMNFCLEMNDVILDWPTEETGQMIIALAQRRRDAAQMAGWLRASAQHNERTAQT